MIKFSMFVDGPNLIGSLGKLRLRVKEYESFFSYILREAVNTWGTSIVSGDKNARLVCVLWYVVGSMDEWDLENKESVATLLEWFKADKNLQKRYLALAGRKLGQENNHQDAEQVVKESWSLCLKEGKDWYNQRKFLVKKFKDFHFGVKSSTDFIDIIQSGHFKVDILNQTITEKGIDTSLAVDMLSLVDTYDVALVISGDADNIPSIQKIKQIGKHVGVIEFIRGFPPEKKGRQSSSKLKAVADFVVPIYETDLQKNKITTSEDVAL